MTTAVERRSGRVRGHAAMDGPPSARRSGWGTLLAWVVGWQLASWVIGDVTWLGFSVTGWAWLFGGAAATVVLSLRLGRIRLPVRYLLPWVLAFATAWILGAEQPAATQTFAQTLCPLVVGCAASSFRVTSGDVAAARRWIRWVPWALWGLAVYRLPSLLRGELLGHGWLTPELCGATLWAAVFVGFVAAGDRAALVRFGAVAALPVVFLVRGPTAAAVLTYPLTPAPLGVRRRLVAVAVVLAVGGAVFASERFQTRMFHSGRGRIEDLRLDNPDLATTGRAVMWAVLARRVDDRPWFGHGVNASRSALTHAGFRQAHPHNDWLKLAFDCGYVGVACFSFGMLATMAALVRAGRRMRGDDRALAYGAATGFVPFLALMLTDNVLLYAQFYGNVHFALVGAAFARAGSRDGGERARS